MTDPEYSDSHPDPMMHVSHDYYEYEPTASISDLVFSRTGITIGAALVALVVGVVGIIRATGR